MILDCNVDVNDAVLNGGTVDVSEDVAVGVDLRGEADRFATEVLDGFCVAARDGESGGVKQRKVS